ncbi:MAG: GNAT family N-acetyltransferase [Chloroflexi bacterium]|nr:GNAT family N-acetyltransferase [Chloroflexota bacterium]
MIRLRSLNLETDAPRCVELFNSASPEPVTVERLWEWERNFPKDGVRYRMVALNANGDIIGDSNCSHVPYMLLGSFEIQVIVSPEYRRRGVGSHLFRDALEFALAEHATRLECYVRDYDPGWLCFALARGFQVERHIFESTLDLATFDEARFAGVIESVQAQGVRFFTLAEIGNTEANQRRLYDLNRRNALDIPGRDPTFPRFEDFQMHVFGASWFRAEGQILAADGDRWIGLTAIGYFAQTNSTYNMFTGVERDYRGRKIALALKLLATRFARELGAVYVRTNNDSQNAPILAINQKLGYQPAPGYFKCVRILL